MKEWICKEEPIIRSDGASVGVGFRQMTELVRCKDCKHITFDNRGKLWCPAHSEIVKADWFCADGVKRDDG
jgi:hypothetical protein